MNIVNKLTLRHLRLNRGRTLITILGIVLSVAMVCCVAGFVLSLRDLGMNEVKNRKGDWHVSYVEVPLEIAGMIAGEGIFSTHYIEPGKKEGLYNVYLRMEKPGRDIYAVAQGIADKYGVERWGGNTELLAMEGIIPFNNVMTTFILIATIAISIIVTGSVIVIANAFFISASERVRQFGLLKSAGATGGQLLRSVLFEAFALMLIALPIGILCGFLIQAGVLWVTNNLFFEIFAINAHNATLAFRVAFNPIIIYISVAIAVLTVLISAWFPARKAAKTSPIDAIRQAKDIQIRPGQMKTSRLTQRLFGFEGTLAAKSLKRSRGKYRATVVSLTVSIILYLSMSSFVWTMNKSVEMQYGGYDFEVLVSLNGELDTLDEADRLLREIPDASLRLCRRTLLETELPDNFYTKQALDSGFFDSDIQFVGLYPMPDAEFAKIVPDGGNGMRGILVNATGTLRRDHMIKEFIPYNCVPGTEIAIGMNIKSEEPRKLGSVTIASVADKIPESLPSVLFAGDVFNILIAESEYRAFLVSLGPDIGATATMYAATTDDPEAFHDAAAQVLGELVYQNPDGHAHINNISQAARLNRNITLAFMLFGYGFITMLSLIAVTSVISTISTGMALRRQEFAMLFSAGMTPEGMDKMLNLESLLYGSKSLFIGMPIGLALAYLIYLAMGATAGFAFQLPWGAMAISAAAVMLLTFGTMRYGKRKMNKISIVEAIRNEAI